LRKVAAIFFLSVLCFNCVGYQYVFNLLEQNNDRQLEAKLDQDDYDESSLISIKAAFSIPYSYLSKSDKFERWNGEIEVNGVQYKYVKRRFFNDSIELLCIPNITATKLKEAKHDFVRMSNDVQSDQQGKKQDPGKLPVFKSLLSEYCEDVPDWTARINSTKLLHHSSYTTFIPQFIGDSRGQPPDLS
jgi:hypothetical protein